MIAVGMRVYWRRPGTPEILYQQDQDFGKERECVCVCERESESKSGGGKVDRTTTRSSPGT